MENIRKTERVHTISCLVHSVSPKIREGLKKLGYIHYTHNEKAECILVDPYAEDFIWWEHTEESLAEVLETWDSTKLYDCGTNEDLFLALAALREDNDYMQWFASNYISKYYSDRPESIHQCKILDHKDFFGDCPYTRNYDDCHKMTADEIVKEFTKIADIKYAKSNPKYIWIAREEDIEDKYSDAFIPGKLNLFYDKPSYIYNSEKGRKEWGCARKIAGIPNYMYLDVTFANSPVKLKMEI